MTTNDLRHAYVQLMDRWSWNRFTSNTFRQAVHPEKGDKLWRVWIGRMNRHLHGHRWERRGEGLYWCRVSEMQGREATHFHGLIGGEGADTLDSRRWKEEWFAMAGIARMETPNSINAVAYYMTKHLERGAEIDFGGSLGRKQLVVGKK